MSQFSLTHFCYMPLGLPCPIQTSGNEAFIVAETSWRKGFRLTYYATDKGRQTETDANSEFNKNTLHQIKIRYLKLVS